MPFSIHTARMPCLSKIYLGLTVYLFLLLDVVQIIFQLNVLLHFQWYLISGIAPSGNNDATFKTGSCWRIVVVFNKTFLEPTESELTRLSFASLQCIIQFSEGLDFEFEGPWTQSSSFELILFMSCYSNSKMNACIKHFNCKIKQWRNRKRFWKNTSLNSVSTERIKYF